LLIFKEVGMKMYDEAKNMIVKRCRKDKVFSFFIYFHSSPQDEHNL
jgi:hypothetical protein